MTAPVWAVGLSAEQAEHFARTYGCVLPEPVELSPYLPARRRRNGGGLKIGAPIGQRCYYCRDSAATWDHVVPRSRGGTNHRRNLVPACQRCNGWKADRTLDEWREAGFGPVLKAEKLCRDCAIPVTGRRRCTTCRKRKQAEFQALVAAGQATPTGPRRRAVVGGG